MYGIHLFSLTDWLYHGLQYVCYVLDFLYYTPLSYLSLVCTTKKVSRKA